SHYLDLPWESLEKAVVKLFSKKSPELAELNLKALRAGRNA
ncbi:MAG TPA: indolepyruvate oxidoreductase, partial [Bacteroidales bacterium]|nr:indolepyruvate oxidoreductase [Bacteroidales bacterium]